MESTLNFLELCNLTPAKSPKIISADMSSYKSDTANHLIINYNLIINYVLMVELP